ncbi:DUF4389 domain-containing protein [Rhodovulum adriaticum]|uniref:Uncharacterized protein DUF4389 n=1 Tax=Rhodovulum adriaticum TaxID=35804 RepID=A0A4R2NWB0_RHOAD|nr:DUF4389 domain-containing protein [Rhodovulum adriaticum]TCP26449.1 uncharacterized protein DUF4389 [Rhodovulum adriaticum]
MTDGPETPAVQADKRAVWVRGAWMVVLMLLFSVAQALLWLTAILQFGWLLFTGKPNPNITVFGTRLGNWLAMTARFQAMESEDKPFPWSAWE